MFILYYIRYGLFKENCSTNKKLMFALLQYIRTMLKKIVLIIKKKRFVSLKLLLIIQIKIKHKQI